MYDMRAKNPRPGNVGVKLAPQVVGSRLAAIIIIIVVGVVGIVVGVDDATVQRVQERTLGTHAPQAYCRVAVCRLPSTVCRECCSGCFHVYSKYLLNNLHVVRSGVHLSLCCAMIAELARQRAPNPTTLPTPIIPLGSNAHHTPNSPARERHRIRASASVPAYDSTPRQVFQSVLEHVCRVAGIARRRIASKTVQLACRRPATDDRGDIYHALMKYVRHEWRPLGEGV